MVTRLTLVTRQGDGRMGFALHRQRVRRTAYRFGWHSCGETCLIIKNCRTLPILLGATKHGDFFVSVTPWHQSVASELKATL
ncbi:MAG: hypothetical protein ACREON_08455 [Gemmatimonadaceae bacterium]